MLSVFGVFVLGWISGIACVPVQEKLSHPVDTSFIAKGTNEIATALLQADVQKEDNLVYSPFGYSAILAVFSEGARGVSREEIANALYFPSDTQAVREAYNAILERFTGKKFVNSPEFKNWFYIYRNYTVEDELQNILRKYYLTEVKCVDRPEDYIKPPKKTLNRESTDSDQTIRGEMVKIKEKETEPLDSKITNFQKEKMAGNSAKEEKLETEEPKVSEKSSVSNKEENQPIENSKYKGKETINEMLSEDDREKKLEEEKITTEEDSQKRMEEEKIIAEGGNQKTLEEEKPMKNPEEMTSIKTSPDMGLKSVEHFSGMTDSSLTIRGEESTPRMVIFNGLYYKGEWDTPFEKKPADDSRVFYKSEAEKISVSTIHSQGVFNFGDIANLDCRAIELPYKGGRYSLLVLVPNSRNGLNKLISNLAGYPLSNIYQQLTEKQMDVCLPSFEINTISKPVSSLQRLGLNKISCIFNAETADLSGISSEGSGLFVEELVQMVTFKVDATYTKANFLTASIASSRSNIQSFQINRPFLFYLRDNLEDLIIVNGKVVDPTPKPSFYFS